MTIIISFIHGFVLFSMFVLMYKNYRFLISVLVLTWTISLTVLMFAILGKRNERNKSEKEALVTESLSVYL